MAEANAGPRARPTFWNGISLLAATLLTACTHHSPATGLASSGPSGLESAASIQPAVHEQSEEQLRASIAYGVAAAWQRSDFAWLDGAADHYVRSRAKTYSGKWQLSVFYSTLSDQMEIPWPQEWYVPDEVGCACKIPLPAHYDEADKRWDSVRAKLGEWAGQSPNSPHAKLALAQMLVNQAWFYRGSGLSGTVPAAAWPLVSRYLEAARQVLSNNRAARSEDPEWFDIMFFVASAQSWSEPDITALVGDLRNSRQLYPTAYQSAASMLLPKWGGSYEDVESFAQQVRADNGDEGLELYARIYWGLGADTFSQTHADWPTLKRGFEAMIRKYPDSRNLNGMAAFACAAGDAESFRAVIGRLGENLTPDTWSIPYESCKARYLAGSS